jgi:hypothetical protein
MQGDWRNPVWTAQIVVFVTVIVVVFQSLYPAADLGFVLTVAAVLGVFVHLGRAAIEGRRRSGPRRDPRFARPADLLDADQHDLVGVRVAIERTVAIPLLAELEAASQGAAPGRAARVAAVLLAHRGAWRFVGIDATRPLPAATASQIFDRWCADVRQRFSPGARRDADAFRSDSLTMVSLHVASPGRIPEVAVHDPDAARFVLESLRDHSATWATRVDLWSAERALSAAELRAADPTLMQVGTDDEHDEAPDPMLGRASRGAVAGRSS